VRGRSRVGKKILKVFTRKIRSNEMQNRGNSENENLTAPMISRNSGWRKRRRNAKKRRRYHFVSRDHVHFTFCLSAFTMC